LRAAELAIDAAAKKAKWERSKVFTLMATLDMNGRGTRGFEAGPGIVTEPPIFNRNQGGISRAEAEVEAASRGYALVRQRIIAEVIEARQQLIQARESLADWRARVLPALERDVRIQNAAFRDGEISYLLMLLNQQRLDTARVRESEFADQAHRARVQLDRAIGRNFDK
jgi:cobalt-zinc-cadmium efflux system outer membrane protein